MMTAFIRFAPKCILVGTVALTAVPRLANGQQLPSVAEVSHAGSVNVDIGRSVVVEAPWPASRVSVTSPQIADVEVLTPSRVLVMGKSIGTTDLIMWNNQEEAWQTQVDVDIDLPRFKDELLRFFPGSALEIQRSDDVIIVSGAVARAEEVDRLHRYLDATELKYVDLSNVAGVHQVEIEVRVAEASRTALRELGVNTLHAGDDFFGATSPGASTGGALVPINMGVPEGAAVAQNIPFEFTSDVVSSPLVTLIAGFPRADLELFVRALAENGYVRILAEPNLTALSGEEASFLAGGEFPIPVVQSGLGGGVPSISIEYKQFGVQLTFRPMVLGDGAIRLYVDTEVSDISERGSVEIQGFRVPAITTRRAATTLELASGQMFGMAGLIQQTTQARASRLPWLGDVPVVGALFSSKRYEHGETELVVLVRASLVEPLSTTDTVPVPGDLHRPPDDVELYLEGRLESGKPPETPTPDGPWKERMGMSALKGPGMWQRYGSPSVAARPTLRQSAFVTADVATGQDEGVRVGAREKPGVETESDRP